MKKLLSIVRIFILIAVASCKGTSQLPSSANLFQSSVFTPVNSFTSGAEGPAVDKNGILYAVNFTREGTIGMVTPTGKASLFVELKNGSVGNGIRFNSHG